MLELSFLMFMVGLFFGLSLFLRRITNPYHPDRTIFYIPSPMLFNVLWGSIFYIGYGILMYQENTVIYALFMQNTDEIDQILIDLSYTKA